MKLPGKETVAKVVVGFLGALLIGWLIWQLSPWVRARAIEGLGGSWPLAVPLVRHGLFDRDVDVRMSSHKALRELGAAAVPALTNSLGDGNARVRAEAVYALGILGPTAGQAITDLVRSMKDEDPRVRVRAAWALQAINPDGPGVFAALLAGAQGESDGEARAAALQALAPYCHRPEGKSLVPLLIDALADPNARVREEAAEDLGRIGPAARDALPALTKLRTDPDRSVRQEVAEALQAITAAEKAPAPMPPQGEAPKTGGHAKPLQGSGIR